MKKVLLLALFGLPLVVRAQLSEMNRDSRTGNLNNGYTLVPAESLELQGTPLLVLGWQPAALLLSGNTKPLEGPLKYDIYRQELRAKRPQGDSVVVPLIKVKEFSLMGGGLTRRFVCYPATTLPAEAGGGCGEVLYDGPSVQLLRFDHKKVVRQAAGDGHYAATMTVSALEQETHYYLRWADGRYSAVKPRRASLEQALAGQPAAQAALKARKGGIGNEAELAAAVAAVAPQLSR